MTATSPLKGRKSPSPAELGVEVGTIFASSWGYDETRVSWYQVTKVLPASVKVRQVAGRVVSGEGSPTVYVVPVPDAFYQDVQYRGGEKLHRLTSPSWAGGTAYFTVNSYASASVWDGTPQYQTGAGWGR